MGVLGKLFNQLGDKGIYAAGTIHRSRSGFPPQLKGTAGLRGEEGPGGGPGMEGSSM